MPLQQIDEQKSTPDDVQRTAESILRILLPFHRAEKSHEHHIATCFQDQINQIKYFVENGEPLIFSLPAFPCKSPNLYKVLGHLPDLGELVSLRFLDRICQDVEKVYAPGASVLICSDGHVFGDLIHVSDEHITEYAAELQGMVDQQELTHLELFNLDDVYGDLSYDDKRKLLVSDYGESIEDLRAEVHEDERTLAIYRGMTRFVFEDTLGPDYTGTRSALLRDSRRRAYGVLQRSRAWSQLVDQSVRSVRLSIHPHACGTPKFGIMLLEAADSWLTPWHSVAVRQGPRVVLKKRAEAEQTARLVTIGGRPSHFVVRYRNHADDSDRAPRSVALSETAASNGG